MKNYEDLAKAEFKGEIVMRSATAPYSKTLLASIIANDGNKEAKAWAKGVLENLATNQRVEIEIKLDKYLQAKLNLQL